MVVQVAVAEVIPPQLVLDGLAVLEQQVKVLLVALEQGQVEAMLEVVAVQGLQVAMRFGVAQIILLALVALVALVYLHPLQDLQFITVAVVAVLVD
jgi:hypothetical protein